MSTPAEVLPYVTASAKLLGIPLDEARAARVAQHLARTAQLAATLEAAGLAAHDEPAEIYCPKAFPGTVDGRKQL